MPQLINLGDELLRINTAKSAIEYSQTGGRSWVTRCSSTSYGTFIDLLQVGREILACTSKGCMPLKTTGDLSRPDVLTHHPMATSSISKKTAANYWLTPVKVSTIRGTKEEVG